jgi:hypothetical protein
MPFGVDVKIKAPKVEIPKVDVAGAVKGAADAAAGAVAGAVKSATSAVTGAVASATAAVSGAVDSAVSSLASVAGAIDDVAVSFTGAIEDIALEPHLQLDANASYGDTKFEKGPVWIRVDLTADRAKANGETLHLRSDDGSFDAKKGIKDFIEHASGYVDVLFEDAPMDKDYSLDVIDERSAVHAMFAGIPYGDLRKTRNRY